MVKDGVMTYKDLNTKNCCWCLFQGFFYFLFNAFVYKHEVFYFCREKKSEKRSQSVTDFFALEISKILQDI